MRPVDLTRFALTTLFALRGRTLLTGLGIAIGIAAVILLTSIGEGVQRFVLAEFTQFGTNLIGIVPGKTTTHGLSGAMISNVRPLRLEDEAALARLPQVEATVPVVQGNAAIEGGSRQRRTTIFGVGPKAPQVWQFTVATGRFLPPDPPEHARFFAVLGATVRRELFGGRNPLGATIRIGGSRYRVLGVMESKGQMLGFDLDDAVYIPAARALELFDRESLMEIDLLYNAKAAGDTVAQRARALLTARHGREDFTINTQDQMLEILGGVLDKLTLAIGGLGAISLLVGGVGILTIMTIAVHERTGEIGLLRALGATRRQVLALFLTEAMAIAALGGTAGLLTGWGGAVVLRLAIPGLPTHTPLPYVLAAELLAIVIGLAAGVLPARRAANMPPVEALRAE